MPHAQEVESDKDGAGLRDPNEELREERRVLERKAGGVPHPIASNDDKDQEPGPERKRIP